eukprot:NODE_174_length_14184_cov_0.583671.p10 type:complete len:139 gc:universal NODE_174_length_14184_cov_0.583671:920-1336(+)
MFYALILASDYAPQHYSTGSPSPVVNNYKPNVEAQEYHHDDKPKQPEYKEDQPKYQPDQPKYQPPKYQPDHPKYEPAPKQDYSTSSTKEYNAAPTYVEPSSTYSPAAQATDSGDTGYNSYSSASGLTNILVLGFISMQ